MIRASQNPFACEPVIFNSTTSISQDNFNLVFEILSTNLSTNDVAGFVNYINNLPAPFLVWAESTASVRFFLTNTFDVYEIIGVGKGTYGFGNLQIATNNVFKTTTDVTFPFLVKKQFAQSHIYGLPFVGTEQVLPLRPNGTSFYTLGSSGLVSVAGFDLSLIANVPGAEVPYIGKEIILFNNTSSPVSLINQRANIELKFFFLENSNLILQPKKIVFFKYDVGKLIEIFNTNLPITGEPYIEKIEKTEEDITGTGSVNHIITSKTACFNIVGNITDFTGFVFLNETDHTYPGKKYTLKNGTANPVILKHDTGIIKMLFPNILDFTLAPNETIEFIFRKRGVGSIMEYVGKIFIAKRNFNFFQQGKCIVGSGNENKWHFINATDFGVYAQNTNQNNINLIVPNYESDVFKVPNRCKIVNIEYGAFLEIAIVKTSNNQNTSLNPVFIYKIDTSGTITNPNITIEDGEYLNIYFTRPTAGQSFFILNITFEAL